MRRWSLKLVSLCGSLINGKTDPRALRNSVCEPSFKRILIKAFTSFNSHRFDARQMKMFTLFIIFFRFLVEVLWSVSIVASFINYLIKKFLPSTAAMVRRWGIELQTFNFNLQCPMTLAINKACVWTTTVSIAWGRMNESTPKRVIDPWNLFQSRCFKRRLCSHTVECSLRIASSFHSYVCHTLRQGGGGGGGNMSKITRE